MKLLFVGESWLGSTARSQRDALNTLETVSIQDIALETFFPRWRSLSFRAFLRIAAPAIRKELASEVMRQVLALRPDALVVAKGFGLSHDLVRQVASHNCVTVNLFPDVAPQIHGRALRIAVGAYDLVISAKPFHPDVWNRDYGYANRCVFVPHGYDSAVHLWEEAPETDGTIDVLLVATCRPEYLNLLLAVASGVRGQGYRIEVRGHGWERHAAQIAGQFDIGPAVTGRAYGELLRSAKVVLAPVSGPVNLRGVALPGDQDTTRTYELPATGCFFLHQRSAFVQSLFNEDTEVPMWDDATELVRLILRYVPDAATRAAMARRAHVRAVPAYSLGARAMQMQALIAAELVGRRHV